MARTGRESAGRSAPDRCGVAPGDGSDDSAWGGERLCPARQRWFPTEKQPSEFSPGARRWRHLDGARLPQLSPGEPELHLVLTTVTGFATLARAPVVVSAFRTRPVEAYRHLTVGHFPQGAAVSSGHAHRVCPCLGKRSLIQNPDSRVTKQVHLLVR